MRFELFVALRYLLALRRQSFISLISLFAVLGVSLGVAALIVVIGVMNGFSTDLRDKILGVNSHIYIGSVVGGMYGYRDAADLVKAVPGVEAVTPFVYSEAMLSAPGGVKGVVLRGIDPETSRKVLSLDKDMTAGSLDDLFNATGRPGIVVGAELARRLGLEPGSRVNMLSPSGKDTSAGFTPKVSVFKVAGVFKTGMFEYDSSLAYVTIPEAQELLGFKTDLASGLEVRVTDIENVEAVSDAVDKALEHLPVYVRNWQEMNANLFAALKLEKTAMFIILVMIVLVGSFSIVTMLVMLVMQKTKDIAVLMSLGAERVRVSRIFMLQGTIIGLAGTVMGYAIGIPVSLILKRYQFIKLPSDVYPVDYLPIRLEFWDMTLIGLAAFLLCFLSTIYPARRAAKLNPADALRYE